MKIYSLDAWDAGSVSIRKTAPREPVPFSVIFNLLTALSVSCLMISAESFIDVYLYAHVDFPVRHVLANACKAVGILPVYTYGFYYWPPLFIVALWAGFAHSKKGLLYSGLGAVIFLILLHNFRGFGTHHNVFETAEYVRRSKNHQPSPEFWDIAYLVSAFSGGVLGIAFAKFKKKDRKDTGSSASADSQAAVKFALAAGTLCMIFGFVEFAIKLFLERNMLYSPLPTMTHGYAVVAMGLLTVGAAMYKDYYQEAALI